jgi:hypothetical protein
LVGLSTCKTTWFLVWSGDMVSPGKPTLGSGGPATVHHYQSLPAANINRVICSYHSSSTASSCACLAMLSTSATGISLHVSRATPTDRHPIMFQITMQDQDTHGGRTGPTHHTTTPNDCDCPDTVCEANKFGKDFLRMAGIVQMLHALAPPYDI